MLRMKESHLCGRIIRKAGEKIVLDRKVLRRAFFYDWAYEDDMIYFSMCHYNALCRANLKNDQVEIIDTFPEIPVEKGNEYFGMCKSGNYLLLGPLRRENNFLVYDMVHSEFIRLPNEGKNNFYSTRAFEQDGCLYIVSHMTGEIVKINLQDFSIKRMACKECQTENAQITSVARVDHIIYISFNEKKRLLIFDLKSEEFTYCSFPQNIPVISTINYYNDRFWITGESKKLYTWKPDETDAQVVVDFPDDVKLFFTRNIWFGNSFIYNDCLWLFPAYSDQILKYNLFTNDFEKIKIAGEEEASERIVEDLEHGRPFPSKYGIVKRYGNKALFLSSKTRVFYELDLLTKKLCKHDFQMINFYNSQMYPPSSSGVFCEYNFGLEGLIGITDKIGTNMKMRNGQLTGTHIYNKIRSLK